MNYKQESTGSQSGSLLELKSLTVVYHTPKGELRAVEEVDLSVKKGEILGIVGESGCGKSTLALSLIRMLPKNARVSGEIRLDSVDVTTLKSDALRRYRWEKVSMVFQSAMNVLDPVKTVESQLVETIKQHRKTTTLEAREKVGTLLEIVKIDPSRAKSYPHQLSGGMRQRVVIALALCLDPEILIADEPTTALDVVVQSDVLRTLKDLQKRLGLTVIMISHDISIMAGMTDRMAVMYAGKIVEIGPTADVIEKPQHPYTEALLEAVPEVGAAQQKIKGIPGYPPDLSRKITGCRFSPRCKYVFEKCRTLEPPLIPVGGSLASCWLRDRETITK
jgi:peptide/nickel transport system ATP-binding protein